MDLDGNRFRKQDLTYRKYRFHFLIWELSGAQSSWCLSRHEHKWKVECTRRPPLLLWSSKAQGARHQAPGFVCAASCCRPKLWAGGNSPAAAAGGQHEAFVFKGWEHRSGLYSRIFGVILWAENYQRTPDLCLPKLLVWGTQFSSSSKVKLKKNKEQSGTYVWPFE